MRAGVNCRTYRRSPLFAGDEIRGIAPHKVAASLKLGFKKVNECAVNARVRNESRRPDRSVKAVQATWTATRDYIATCFYLADVTLSAAREDPQLSMVTPWPSVSDALGLHRVE